MFVFQAAGQRCDLIRVRVNALKNNNRRIGFAEWFYARNQKANFLAFTEGLPGLAWRLGLRVF